MLIYLCCDRWKMAQLPIDCFMQDKPNTPRIVNKRRKKCFLMKWSCRLTIIRVMEEYNEPGVWWQRTNWCHATAQFFPSAILDRSLSSKYEGKSSCRSNLVFSFSSCSMLLKFKVSPRGIISLKVGSNFGWRVLCHEGGDAWKWKWKWMCSCGTKILSTVSCDHKSVMQHGS